MTNTDAAMANSWNDYLRTFHRDVPRATSESIEQFVSCSGKTTYRLLADTLAEFGSGSAVSVLDLGCGEGRLVDDIRAVRGSSADVYGLDLSQDEIERARSSGRQATFVAGTAVAIPFEARRFDSVLSHFAFMLMVPIESVVREIERVLVQAGFFATACWWLGEHDGDLGELLSLLREAYGGRTHPSRPVFDPRQTSPTGIAELFEAAGSGRRLRHRRESLTALVDGSGAWTYLTTLYFFETLGRGERALLQSNVERLVKARGGVLQLAQNIDIVVLY